MILTLALAAAALPTPAQTKNIRCVAALAIVANAQARGAGWRDVEDVRKDGAEFAAITGDDVMTSTGATREDVGAMMRTAVGAIRREKGPAKAEVSACIVSMKAYLIAVKAAVPEAERP